MSAKQHLVNAYGRALQAVNGVMTWLRYHADAVAPKVALVHFVALLGLAALWYAGALGVVFAKGGVFAWLVFATAIGAAAFGTRAALAFDRLRSTPHPEASRHAVLAGRNAVTWLEFADGAVLILGFLGTLQGAIIELTNLDPTAQGAALLLMLKSVIRGVGVAIYTTMAGTAAALWTSVATKLLNNAVEAEAERAAARTDYQPPVLRAPPRPIDPVRLAKFLTRPTAFPLPPFRKDGE